jgi:hypothetical protein
VDLLQHALHLVALGDDVAVLQRAPNRFSQVVALTLGALFQLRNLFERAGIRDRHRRVVGEDAQPVQVRLFQPAPAEEGHDPEHLPLEAQRLPGEALNAFGLRPLRLHQPISRSALQQERPVVGGDVAHHAVRQQNLLLSAIGAVPPLAWVDERRADAGFELQIRRLAIAQEPNARQRDSVPHTQALHHLGEHGVG